MTTDVLVIGGGLAGSASAIRLASQGVRVTLVERDRGPQHKVCGEFLSGEALHYLDRLGINVSQLGAVQLQIVRLTGSGTPTESALPFPAMSLTRRSLDDALLRRAESAGVNVRRGCAVERLVRVDDAWQASFATGENVSAAAVFLATGKHDLRGLPRPAGKQHGLVAFKMYWRLSAAQARSLGRAVELITYRDGYAGLQPVEDGLANLCCLVKAETLRNVGRNWAGLLAHMREYSPHLRERLHGAEPMLAKPLTIASLPYGFVRASSDGLWYVGDQAAVIPSFTGDGMSLALHTAILAADSYLRGERADAYQRTVASQVSSQVGFATTVSRAIVNAPRAALLLPSFWPGTLGLIARKTRIADEYLIA